MAEKNRHKFEEKQGFCSDDIKHIDNYQKALSLNYSRSLGVSGNWIGSGYIVNKIGANGDHLNVRFPYFSLVYVVHGEGAYIDKKGNKYPLSAGSVFMRQPGVPHTTLVDPESGWKEYYLDCNEDLYKHLSSMSLVNKDKPVYSGEIDSSVNSSIDALMTKLQNGSEDEVLDAYIQFLTILRKLLTWHDHKHEAKDIIRESLSDFEQSFHTRFDLKEYCREKGWGYEKFRKAFKKQLGVSPRDYLIRKRMDEACRLLRSTDMQISAISMHLGYASQYEFSNQFNKMFAIAPKHYREGV